MDVRWDSRTMADQPGPLSGNHVFRPERPILGTSDFSPVRFVASARRSMEEAIHKRSIGAGGPISLVGHSDLCDASPKAAKTFSQRRTSSGAWMKGWNPTRR